MKPFTRVTLGLLAALLALPTLAEQPLIRIATYNIENQREHFRAHHINQQLPRAGRTREQEDFIRRMQKEDDEDKWEVAQVILDERLAPDVLVIQEGAGESDLQYFNKKWLKGLYETVIVFPTNTRPDFEQNLAMMLKPGFKVIERRDQYYLEPDTVPNPRGDRLFARGPAFVLVESPSGYRFWVGTTHQKSKRVSLPPASATAATTSPTTAPSDDDEEDDSATDGTTQPTTRKLTRKERLAMASIEATAWRNREAARTRQIMLELRSTSGVNDVILLGDMNDELGLQEFDAEGGGDTIEILTGPPGGGLTLATRELSQTAHSFKGYWPYSGGKREVSFIDHIVISDEVKDQVVSVSTLDETMNPFAWVASDHLPVMITIRAEGPPAAAQVAP